MYGELTWEYNELTMIQIIHLENSAFGIIVKCLRMDRRLTHSQTLEHRCLCLGLTRIWLARLLPDAGEVCF